AGGSGWPESSGPVANRLRQKKTKVLDPGADAATVAVETARRNTGAVSSSSVAGSSPSGSSPEASVRTHHRPKSPRAPGASANTTRPSGNAAGLAADGAARPRASWYG